jgi:prolipoprotein diacylglyceryl transferase
MNILTSIPIPGASFFQIGPFRVHFFALFVITAVVLAVILSSRRLSRRGGEPGIVLDITLWAVPFGIVGGRLYHVVTHPNDYFFAGADLWKVLYVWEGGIAIFGVIVFGSLGAWIACRRYGIRFLSFADAVAPGLIFAQAFGRIGDYFGQELFGNPTTLPWGLQIDPSRPAFPAGLPADTLFLPLFLYEMLWNLIGFAIILLIDRRFTLRWGKAIGLYLILYGTGRSWLETLRLDPTEFEILGLKINMIIAILIAVLGVVLIIVQQRRHPEPETSPYLPGREWSPVDASAPAIAVQSK